MSLIYAHRGARREAAENTRSAFDRALDYPIDGIETDIQLTRDGVCVLWHDDDLKKLGLPGTRIDDCDLSRLQAMDFAAHFPGAAKGNVMRLQDFVAAYRARCRLLLEIKRYPGEAEARQQDKVAQTLAAAGTGSERMLVSSFDLDSLIHAHRLAPDFPLVLNLEPEHDANFAQQTLIAHPWLHGLCVHIATLDEGMTGVVREGGKRIAVYTCNSDAQIGRALRLGVDILISDVPQQALQMRAA
ncbi:glycerophosphodiester phosphodiesterase [Ferrigenium sp. UT5]|uniref:glycerophosphodiester phosphodiesterase n=1 Tax=Ferrigenium sp. UT5 TaxID=3242105 RepID=UPI00354B89FE